MSLSEQDGDSCSLRGLQLGEVVPPKVSAQAVARTSSVEILF